MHSPSPDRFLRILSPSSKSIKALKKIPRYSLVLIALGCAGSSQLLAQFRASLTGTVTDPQKAVVPGAKVTLIDADTGRSIVTNSNDSGVFSFNGLAPDHYSLVTVMPGFKNSTIRDVVIKPEQPNNIAVELSLGDTSTVVDVNADTLPTIETSTATMSGTISSNDIQHLPSAGRDVFQLAQLAPGAFGDGSQGGGGGTNNLPGTQGPGGSAGSVGFSSTENGPQTLSGGGQYETNGIQIDGISTSSAVWGGTSVITPNEDSVESVTVTTNAYDAQDGRFSGAQIQVTSKSGTNAYHGSLFFRANRPGLNAYQRYNGPASLNPGTPEQRGLLRSEDRFNQIGGSVGGAFWKDHVFGFFAYETIRNNSNAISNGWYETPAFDSTVGGPIATVFNTFKGNAPVSATLLTNTCATAGLTEGTNCKTIVGSGLDVGSPIKSGIGTQDLAWTGQSNPGIGGGLDGVADVAQYQTSSPSSYIATQYNGRLDANVTRKDRVTFAIYWVPLTKQSYQGTARAYNLFNHNQINEAYSGIWSHTFSPTLINEARVNDAGWRWNEVTSNPQEPFGLPQDQVDMTGNFMLSFFGAPGPSVFNQHTYTYRDIVTKTLHNHNIRMGAEVTRLYYLNNPTYSARPSYNFYNIWDFLNDAPHSESGQFSRFTGVPTPNRFDNRENLWGGFIQDDWKVTPRLTLNLGLRYSYFDSLYAKQDNLPAVRFGTGANAFTGISISRGGHLWNPQSGNFAPQFGLSYNPEALNGKMVIHAGFGMNYNQNEIAITGNFANNPNDAVSPSYTSGDPAAINPNIVYAVPSNAFTIFGYPANPHTITNYNAANLPTTTGLGLTAFPTNLKTSYTYHYSLDTQMDVGHQTAVTVGYQGSTGFHLISQQNLYVSGAYNGIAFNPQVSSIGYFGNYASSNYNALLVSVKHNMSHHFMLNGDFTYSKSMDDGSGPYEEDPYPYNPTFARGRSDFNFGKAAKVYGVWQPVFFKGNSKWLEKIAGGWSISGIYNIHSGFPWNPVSNGANAYYDQSGYGSLRPSAYFGGAGHDYSNKAFKPGAGGFGSNFPGGGLAFFAKPTYTTGTFPNVGSFPVPGIARNSFTGPKYQDLDGTLTKSFGLPKLPILGEGAGFEIRADVFNFLNNENLNISQIDKDISDTSFGVITGSSAALASRTVNLQARFSF